MKRSNGFTLIEVLLAIVIMGVAMLAVVGLVNQTTSLVLYEREQTTNTELRAIAKAYVKYAALHNDGAFLPPYTAGNCYNCAIDTTVPEMVAYTQELGQRDASAMNYDTTSNQWVRGLMLASGTQSSVFSIATASNIVLEFTSGVVVQTSCFKGSACDTSSDWATPNYSPSGWTPHVAIQQVIPFNNLQLMQERAVSSVNNLRYLQGKFRDYVQELVIANPAITDTNYMPLPNLAASPDYSATDPTTNGGCINGWYNLAAADVNVLAIVGVTQDYGTTAFGGAVEYCADFDLTAVDASNADTPPHVGALRVLRTFTGGAFPSSNNANNIILPI